MADVSKTTTKDIARECGVSLSTVQRALHSNGRINEETKNKILETAKRLNYQPDMVARSLVSGKSKTIGAIIPTLDNMYYSTICHWLTIEVAKQGYMLNILVHEDDKKMEKKMIQTLASHHVDGIILNPINKGQDLVNILRGITCKGLLLGMNTLENSPFPYIGNDEYRAGYEATDYILAHGYRSLVFIAPTLQDRDGVYNYSHQLRLAGIRDRMHENNLEPVVIDTWEYPQLIARTIVEMGAAKPAILCTGEVFAFETMKCLYLTGREPGRDYGIMTFDYTSLAAFNWNIRLAALDNRPNEIGNEAGKIMLRMIDGDAVDTNTVIPFHIVDGNTL